MQYELGSDVTYSWPEPLHLHLLDHSHLQMSDSETYFHGDIISYGLVNIAHKRKKDKSGYKMLKL